MSNKEGCLARGLSGRRKIVIKEDWKSTLLLLPDYATDVEQSSWLT